MKWLMRFALALGAFAVLLLLVIGAAAWVLGSERGSAWLVASLVERAAPALAVAQVSGTLLYGLTLRDVALVVNADRIEVDEIEIELELAGVLRNALVVDEVHATQVLYTRGPSTGARAPAQIRLPRLPLTIEVRRAMLDGLTVASDQERLEFAATSLAARYAAGELVVERVETGLQGARLTGRAGILARDQLRLDAEIEWELPQELSGAAGWLTINGTLPELDVHHELRAPFPATTDGKLWVEDPPRVDLELAWTDAAIPGRAALGSVRGTAAVEGPVDALAFSSMGSVAALGREFAYSVSGDLDGGVIEIAPLTVTGPGGSVAATGTFALDTLTWDLSLAGTGLNPAPYAARWPGQIDVAAELQGRLRPQPEVRARAARLSGSLRGFPFAAAAEGAFEYPNRWRVDALEIARDGDVVRVRGNVDERLDLALEARFEHLERWWPEAAGSVIGNLTVAGTLDEPRVGGSIEARELEFRGYDVAGATLEGSVVAAAGGAVDLRFAAGRVRGSNLNVEAARASVAGTIEAHAVDIALESTQWGAAIAARGGWDARLWRGSIESARLRESALGEWRLARPTKLELARERAVLEPTCLVQAGTSLCAALRLTGSPDDQLSLSATNFDVQALQPFLPENFVVGGIYQLSAAITDLRGAQRGYVALAGGATRVRIALSEQQFVDEAIESVALHANLDGGRLDLNFALNAGEAGRVDLEAVVADLRAADSPVDGRLDLNWRDLEALSLLSPDIGGVMGNVTAQLDFGGTLVAPELSGRAQLSEGVVEVPAWALRVERITGTAVTVDGTSLEYSGSGFVDAEEVYISGRTELDPARNWPTRLRVRGESLQLAHRTEAEVFASPDLEVDVALPNISVRGAVHVPRAVIALEQLPAQAVRPSADSIVHGVTVAAPVRPLRVQADVRITLGEDVQYNAANLRTEVEGELGLRYQSGLTPSGSGSLSLTGTYNAYGQLLELERGELLFTGPLDDPAIDVRARRVIEETTVGVQLTGTLKSPTTRIYSDPAMSEADALSYLLLGRPLSGTGEEETATLESAALAMGLQQALPAVQRIGTTLGLDELTIQSTDADSGALMAGKYLSPRLYVRYSYGLFNRVGGLLVRFQFSDRLSIESRSGDEDSVDLLYTVEKD
jgi:translocation and assembly module TamB